MRGLVSAIVLINAGMAAGVGGDWVPAGRFQNCHGGAVHQTEVFTVGCLLQAAATFGVSGYEGMVTNLSFAAALAPAVPETGFAFWIYRGQGGETAKCLSGDIFRRRPSAAATAFGFATEQQCLAHHSFTAADADAAPSVHAVPLAGVFSDPQQTELLIYQVFQRWMTEAAAAFFVPVGQLGADSQAFVAAVTLAAPDGAATATPLPRRSDAD